MIHDVGEAHQLLKATLNAALEAQRQHTAGQNAVAVEELAAWEKIGAALVPSFSRETLQQAGALVGDARLDELLAARDKTRAGLDEQRAVLEGAVLDPVDLDDLAKRRKRIEERIASDRVRWKELRQKPGLLARLDDLKKGARLKDDALTMVRAHEELRVNIEALETELSRLAAASARHHRSNKQLGELVEQIKGLDDGFLRDARRIVVDRLMQPGAPRPDRPGLATHFHVIDGVSAKRAALTWLYENWVRPHGNALIELHHEGQNVSGFETVSWPAKVDLRCREAAVSVDACRRSSNDVVAFADYASVKNGDWWSALVKGVPRPQGAGVDPVVFGDAVDDVGPARAVADVAKDKLAAAWATMSDPGGAPVDDSVGDGFLGMPTEQLAMPQPTALFARVPGKDKPQPIPGFEEETLGDEENPFAEASREIVRPSVVTVDVGRSTFAAGTTVGRCVIEALIGKGGMGEVYRARLTGDGGFARPVVLKRLSIDRSTDPTVAMAFAREAEIAARIAHPNVVQIFDVQSANGEPFIIMELLEGLTLQKLVNRALRDKVVVDVSVIARCAIDAARGLHAAHSLRGDDGSLVGLVHRDVSPDNLFLCQNGFTKLLDFGIARRNDLTTMTGKSELKGKIPYMSPEQIVGDPLDARSDLFSLGSTLYWILTGARPFVGDNEVTTLYAVVNKAHASLRSVRGDAGGVADVVEQLLQKRREDRPASAAAVVQLLERCHPATPEEAAAFLAKLD